MKKYNVYYSFNSILEFQVPEGTDENSIQELAEQFIGDNFSSKVEAIIGQEPTLEVFLIEEGDQEDE